MSITPWKVLKYTYFRPRFRLDKCELPNGKFLNATVLEFSPWANALAVTKNNEAVLIKQYRHGVQKILWEIPGGVVEDNEHPSNGAKRELLEETGYSAPEFIEVGKIYPNPAFQTNTMYCFLALNAEKISEQSLDDGEDIEIRLVPMDKLVDMMKNGEISHALQLAALFHALVHMERIR